MSLSRIEGVTVDMKRNVKLAIAFIGLNILDSTLATIAIRKGTLYEANPIMRYLLELPYWWVWLWVVKIGAIIICTAVLLELSKEYPKQIRKIFIGLIIAMVGVCVVNMIGVV